MSFIHFAFTDLNDQHITGHLVSFEFTGWWMFSPLDTLSFFSFRRFAQLNYSNKMSADRRMSQLFSSQSQECV